MIRTGGFHEKMKTVPLVNMKEGGKRYKFLIQWTKQPIGALVSFGFFVAPMKNVTLKHIPQINYDFFLGL
jgi:hypothetical protein